MNHGHSVMQEQATKTIKNVLLLPIRDDETAKCLALTQALDAIYNDSLLQMVHLHD